MNHTIRHEDGGTVEVKGVTRTKAIKLMCTECMGWITTDVGKCTSTLCPLYPYRRPCMAAKGERIAKSGIGGA
jgi:hypothetical protein